MFTGPPLCQLVWRQRNEGRRQVYWGEVGPDGTFRVVTMRIALNFRRLDEQHGKVIQGAPPGWADGSDRCLTPHKFGISNTLVWDKARGMMVFGNTLRQTLFRID